MGSLIEKLFSQPEMKCVAGLALTPLLGPAAPVQACREAVEKRLAPQTKRCEPGVPPELCEAGNLLLESAQKQFRVFKRIHPTIPGLRCRIERSVRDLSLSILGLSRLYPVAVGLEKFIEPNSCRQDQASMLHEAGKLAAQLAISSAAVGMGAMAARSLARTARKTVSEAVRPQALETAIEVLGGPGARLLFSPLF